MTFTTIKSLFFKLLIASLVAAASIAVIAVLIGEFNEALKNALLTIGLMVIHSLLSFGFVANNEEQETFENVPIFSNTVFGVIVLSFATSVLGVWDVITGDVVANFYILYFVILFAVMHSEIIAKTLGITKAKDTLVYANLAFIIFVVGLLTPVIFAGDPESLGSLYYRILAAASIVDATMTLIIIILHKLYIDQHPKTVDPMFYVAQSPQPLQPGVASQAPHPGAPVQVVVPRQKQSFLSVILIVFVVYIAFQFILGIGVALLGGLFF